MDDLAPYADACLEAWMNAGRARAAKLQQEKQELARQQQHQLQLQQPQHQQQQQQQQPKDQHLHHHHQSHQQQDQHQFQPHQFQPQQIHLHQQFQPQQQLTAQAHLHHVPPVAPVTAELPASSSRLVKAISDAAANEALAPCDWINPDEYQWGIPVDHKKVAARLLRLYRTQCATFIQALFRGYRVRKALRPKRVPALKLRKLNSDLTQQPSPRAIGDILGAHGVPAILSARLCSPRLARRSERSIHESPRPVRS